MADQRRLAAPVLADDRDRLARRDRRDRPRRAPGSRPGRRTRRPRRRRPVIAARPRGIQAARHQRALRAGRATAARRRAPRAADRRGPRRSRPSRAIRPASSATTESHSPSSRSVLCSAISSAVPVRASALRASPTSREPSGSSCAVGSSRTRCAGRIASSEARTTSCPCPPDRRRGSRSARCSMPRVPSASCDARHRLARRAGRGSSGPSATSSKTDPVTPDSWVAEFWNPMADAGRELVERLAGHRLAVDPQAAAAQRSADRAGRQAGRDEAERRLARLRWPRRPRRAAVVEASGRCRAGPGTRSPRSDTRRRAVPASRPPLDPAGDARDRGDDEQQDEDPAEDPLPRGIGHRPEQLPLAGSAERPRLEREAALLDIGQRREDDRPDERAGTRGAGPGSCPRCRGRGLAGSRRSPRRARRGSGPPRSSRPRRTPGAARRRGARGRTRTRAARSSG